jgi:hypothetical protein
VKLGNKKLKTIKPKIMVTINSIFDVNDLATSKFHSQLPGKVQVVYEILQIDTQKCYGGVQVFVQARPLHIIYDGYGKDRKISNVEAAFLRTGIELARFREDELVPLSEELKSLLSSVMNVQASVATGGDSSKQPGQ